MSVLNYPLKAYQTFLSLCLNKSQGDDDVDNLLNTSKKKITNAKAQSKMVT